MQINPFAKRILCYGDSNTYGQMPHGGEKEGRYPANIRWTGKLQELLGNGYEVIEEGLGGRTTNIDDPVRGKEKNGLSYLPICLGTHRPLDIVILFLGTNDLKERFGRDPKAVGEAISSLIHTIQQFDYNTGEATPTPKILLVSPPLIDESCQGVKDDYKGAEEKSKKLGNVYENIARENDCLFINLFPLILPSPIDGIHFDAPMHTTIAATIAAVIKEYLQKEGSREEGKYKIP